MQNFDDAFSRLMANEGGYANREFAADPGGETMYGITLKVARAWGYLGPMKDLPLETAKSIARANYWKPYYCDQLPPAIAFHVFDTAFHGGSPIRWLQSAVGATPDGIVGSKTIAAIRAAQPAETVMAFTRKRAEYLMGLKNWPQNSKGWTARLMRNMEVF